MWRAAGAAGGGEGEAEGAEEEGALTADGEEEEPGGPRLGRGEAHERIRQEGTSRNLSLTQASWL